MLTAKKAKQLASMPERSIPRGDTYGQRQHLKSVSREREQLMRQFVKGDGPRGATTEYLDGWDRIWGDKKGKAS